MKMKRIELSKNEIIIAKTLFDFFVDSKYDGLITYSGLANKTYEYSNEYKNTPRNLCKPLESINRLCHYYNAPMISVIVINRKKCKPGEGFFILYKELKTLKYNDSHKNKYFLNEWKKVRDYKRWDVLYNIINDLYNNIHEEKKGQ